MKTTEKTELQLLSEISRISNSSIELQEKLQRIGAWKRTGHRSS